MAMCISCGNDIGESQDFVVLSKKSFHFRCLAREWTLLFMHYLSKEKESAAWRTAQEIRACYFS